MDKRPFLWLGIASFLSALICSLVSTATAAVWIGAMLAVAVLALTFRSVSALKTVGAMALAAAVIGGMYLAKDCLTVLPYLQTEEQTVYAKMRVDDVLSSGVLVVRVEDGDIEKGTRLYLWSYRGDEVEDGDLLSGQVCVEKGFDTEDLSSRNLAKASGIYLRARPVSADALSRENPDSETTFRQSGLRQLRKVIHSILYTRLRFDDAALSESMFLGERRELSQNVSESFRVGGVYHLLAVSGLHLTVITGAVVWLMKMLKAKRWIQAIAAMTATVGFMILCGLSMSIMRAGVMTLIVLAAYLIHRRADGLNSLGFAATAMLCADPFCVCDLGWQLSFAATFGILLMLPVWQKEVVEKTAMRLPSFSFVTTPLLSAVGITLCATLMTQPLTALYFGEVSLLFLVGNLLCVTVSSALLVSTMLLVMAAYIPLIADALCIVIHALCEWLRFCTAQLQEIPWATVIIREPFVIVWLFALTAVLILGYYLLKWRGVLRAATLMCAALCLSVALYAVVMNGVTTIAVADTKDVCFAVRSTDGCGLVMEGNTATCEEATALLKEENITKLDWCLTSGLSEGEQITLDIPVDMVLLTDAFETEAVSTTPYHILADGATAVLGNDTTLLRDGECYSLCVGDTVMRIVFDAAAIPTALSSGAADVLLADADALESLTPPAANVFYIFATEKEATALSQTLPLADQQICFSADGDCRAILMRGNGDIVLRSY